MATATFLVRAGVGIGPSVSILARHICDGAQWAVATAAATRWVLGWVLLVFVEGDGAHGMQRAGATATVTGCMLWGVLLAFAFPLSLAALLGRGHGSIQPTEATPAVRVYVVVDGLLLCPSALETHPGQYAAGSGYRRCDGLCTVSAVVCLSLCTAACNGQWLLCHCCVACCHGRWRFFGCSAGVVLVLGGWCSYECHRWDMYPSLMVLVGSCHLYTWTGRGQCPCYRLLCTWKTPGPLMY